MSFYVEFRFCYFPLGAEAARFSCACRATCVRPRTLTPPHSLQTPQRMGRQRPTARRKCGFLHKTLAQQVDVRKLRSALQNRFWVPCHPYSQHRWRRAFDPSALPHSNSAPKARISPLSGAGIATLPRQESALESGSHRIAKRPNTPGSADRLCIVPRSGRAPAE